MSIKPRPTSHRPLPTAHRYYNLGDDVLGVATKRRVHGEFKRENVFLDHSCTHLKTTNCASKKDQYIFSKRRKQNSCCNLIRFIIILLENAVSTFWTECQMFTPCLNNTRNSSSLHELIFFIFLKV